MLRKKRKLTPFEEFKLKRELGMGKELTKDYIKDLGERILFFAHESDGSVHISRLIADEGISRFIFFTWLKKYPDLKEAYEEAKEIMATKVLQGALTRKYDGPISKWYINCISQEFRQATKELSHDEEEKKHTVIIKEIRAEDAHD
jgi:hypothetical protein